MPIYEYECTERGHRFEKWQSIQDEPIKMCSECTSPVRKIFHPAGLIFKGSGWYVTDNRKPGADGKTETPVGEKAETKAEAPKTASPAAKAAAD